ncbi:helix-turn-helix domain-containing protein (plasmid) [Methylomarinum sp. Ch1-1]|uniref:Helix-turn-helix domain-containing protein n=1 Tax=Methylomarinum roseum TaxID=3067653 RepID=A0AAU7P0C0_9GAMM
MPIRVIIELTETERETLDDIIKKGHDWRERDRAMTIKLLSQGLTVSEVAKQQGYHEETIRRRRRLWKKKGFCSLPDQPRSGAPNKLTDEERQLLKTWVEQEALTSRALLSRLEERGAADICDKTLHNELKRMGFIWKRTRYSLKKNAIPKGSNKPDRTLSN